jgi:hypothetical protein
MKLDIQTVDADGALRETAAAVAGDTRAQFLAKAGLLGGGLIGSVAKPTFDFRGTTESADAFAATARVLEDTGVAAYAGQAPKVKAKAILAAALAIHSVEARHAAWIRDITGAAPAPEAFDEPLTKGQVLAAVADTRFIVRRRRTRRMSSGNAAARFAG